MIVAELPGIIQGVTSQHAQSLLHHWKVGVVRLVGNLHWHIKGL